MDIESEKLPNTSETDQPEDSLLAAINRMNLLEREQLERLGFEVNNKGEVSLPLKHSLLSALKERLGRTGLDDQKEVNYERRQFLINTARLLAVAGVGLALEFPKNEVSAHEVEEGRDNVGEPDSDIIEKERRIVRIEQSRIEFEGLSTLLLADKLCLYQNAPLSPEEGGIVPSTNREFFDHRRHELLGFVEKPSFLVIHTDGGADVRSTVQSLNNRNIHCQFVVGTLNGQVTSIQCVPLERNRINVTGTVSGGEVNPYEANIQFWGSLNIEIEGMPDDVEHALVAKTVDLCLSIMPTYNLNLSQIIGHMEVPNNGKVDPGRAVLKEIRTMVYIRLLEEGLFHLIDIFPDNRTNLEDLFTVENPSGAAQLNNEGRAKCWLPSIDDFCDWNQIESFLLDNPELANELQQYRGGKINLVPVKERSTKSLNEIYMGFPVTYTEWLRLPHKPLGTSEFNEYMPNATARFIMHMRNLIAGNEQPLGSTLPFSYEACRNLARLFIETAPYENRGNPLAKALVNIAENINNQEQEIDLGIIRDAYSKTYGHELANEEDIV